MDYDGAGIQTHGARATAAAVMEASSSLLAPPLDEETLWQMNMRGSESMESGSYPQRPREPDCAYYIRTGLCRYGVTCRYNHPPNRKLYYLKTGTCKFGATCKFHHPKDKAGILGRAELNILGHPIRPNEEECAYYLRTGQCKFGNTCKFHHPPPSNVMVSLRGSPFYHPVHSPTSTSQSYAGDLTSWPSSRASFIPSPRWQGPSSYAQVILPQGLVQVPSWNSYPGSSESQQQAPGTVQIYGSSPPSETSAGARGIVSSYRSSSIPMGQYALQMDNAFPERPDQPECQFYMKTGDCKFGAACKFHHPKERLIPAPDCLLSPSGLPLRPGEPLCVFYSRYGICKFGPNCKFDHPVVTPMGLFAYSLSTSASADIPIVRRLLASSSVPPALTLSSERSVEAGTGKPRRLSMSESQQMSSGDEHVEAEGSHTTSGIGQVSSFS